jgi:hypothetical protein
MSSPDQEHKPEAASLDAERARLRSAGYTDAEISQILIARASQQPAGTGQGALSNVLSSIVAVAGHVRALIPTFRKDVATMFDGAATVSERAGATASLAVKAVVILVLGYAAWQEWRIHIIYATETAHQQALKTTYEALIAQGQSAKVKHIPSIIEEESERAERASPSAVPENETEGQKCIRRFNDRLRAFGWRNDDGSDSTVADTPDEEQRCLKRAAQTAPAATDAPPSAPDKAAPKHLNWRFGD